MNINEAEIKRKLEYAIQINSELPELELKTASNNVPRDIWKSISAFSHRHGGGIIVFGVKEDPVEVIDCRNIHQIQNKLIEYFNQKMSFILRPQYYIIPYDSEKTIVAVYVPECPREYRPCYYKPVGLPNGAYIREGHTNRSLTDNEFRTYVASSKQFRYDLSEAPNADIEDLSIGKISALLSKKDGEIKRDAPPIINEDLLKNIGLAGEFSGVIKPTLAGALIFAKSFPGDQHPYERYTLRCVRFSGNNSASDIIDKLDAMGTLDQQIDDAYKFVLKNIRKKAEIKGTKRKEKYEYPELAIRELIANAVIHRDYKIIETYTHIHIYNDRIEITNPGCLPPGVTVENIKDAQFSRNATIASRLKDLNYLEEYGRGVDLVFGKMSDWRLPPPLFRNSSNSFQSILLGEKFKGLNLRQIKIVDRLLLKGNITIKDCLKMLKNVPRPTVNTDLKTLRQMGLIKQKGASVSTFYVLSI